MLIKTFHQRFTIPQSLMKLHELEFQIYRENTTSQLTVTVSGNAIIEAVLPEFDKKSLNEYLNGIFHITEKISQEETTNNSSEITLHICSYRVLKINFEKLKKCTKKNQ